MPNKYHLYIEIDSRASAQQKAEILDKISVAEGMKRDFESGYFHIVDCCRNTWGPKCVPFHYWFLFSASGASPRSMWYRKRNLFVYYRLPTHIHAQKWALQPKKSKRNGEDSVHGASFFMQKKQQNKKSNRKGNFHHVDTMNIHMFKYAHICRAQ